MDIFTVGEFFPKHERFSLTDQIRRSSRSIAANISEAWCKRRYKAAFIAKLNDAAGECAETQTWLEFARRCNYMSQEQVYDLDQRYDRIMGQLVHMISHPDQWLTTGQPEDE